MSETGRSMRYPVLTGTLLLSLASASCPVIASDLHTQSIDVNTGTHAARLTVGACTAGDVVLPDGPLASDPGVEPCGKLTANDVDIEAGSIVHFRAGGSIALGESFSVGNGASFVADLSATMAGDAFVRDETPSAVTDFYARFYIDPGNLALDTDSDSFDHLVAYDAAGNKEFLIGVTYESGAAQKRLFMSGFSDNGAAFTTKDVCEPVLGHGWQFVEAHWTASTGTDGDVVLRVNGGAPQVLSQCLNLATGLDNDTGEISAVEWGARNAPAGYLGSMGLDDFDSRASAFLTSNPERLQTTSPPVNPTASTDFGRALGLDGDVLVVGAPGEDTAAGSEVGAVYVFERDGFAWIEKQRLTAPGGGTAFEEFGYSVDVAVGDSGEDFLIVGAIGPNAIGGRAYIFKRSGGGQWLWEAPTLSQDSPMQGDRFGESVAIDFFQPPNDPSPPSPDFFAAVGALNNDDGPGGGSNHGSVSIFQRTGGAATWGPTGQEFFGAFADQLGAAVAMGGPSIVVGAEGEDGADGTDTNSGGARVYGQGNLGDTGYFYAGGQKLLPLDPQPAGTSEMGTVAAADYNPTTGGTAVLGAWGFDDGAFNTGKVYIYDLGVGAILYEIASLQAPGTPAGALFGRSVALSDGILAVGAPGFPAGSDGTVFLYEQGATKADWVAIGQLTVPDAPPVGACQGGRAVGLSGLTAAVGCPSNGFDNEAVFMYFGDAIFADGFESGDTSAWTSSTP